MHSDITFFTTFKAFDHAADAIGQQSAVFSWLQEKLDCNPILAIGNDKSVDDFCKQQGLLHLPKVKTAADIGLGVSHPMLRSLFEVALANTKTGYICLINSDIIVTPHFHTQLGALLFKNPNPFVAGIRYDMNITAPVVDAHSYQTICRRTDGKIHRTGGTDYFAFSVPLARKLLSIMPDYIMGAAAWDNWIHWAGLKHSKTPICTIKKARIIHANHTYRQLGKNVVKTIYEHPAVQHNMKIYKSSKQRAGASGGPWRYV